MVRLTYNFCHIWSWPIALIIGTFKYVGLGTSKILVSRSLESTKYDKIGKFNNFLKRVPLKLERSLYYCTFSVSQNRVDVENSSMVGVIYDS